VNVPTGVWFATIALAVVVFAIDVFVIARRPHVPSTREVSTALGVYVGAAVLFGLGIWYFSGLQYAGEYFAGWLTEYSLSVDNLFIFLLIMAKFSVPEKYQQSALMIGIIIAVVLRGIFIAVGAAAIENYTWVFYLFGAFLIYTAVKLAREGESDDDEYEENRFMRFVERRFPATQSYHGTKLFILENGNSDTTNNFGSNVETALDIEAAHGVATGVAMKYYASECAPNPPPNTGLANDGCNGTDVGMEMAMEDAANDPTLHSVSNSWAYGGEAEWVLRGQFQLLL
jgi:hypothetical protein